MYFPIGDIHGAYDDLRRLYDCIVKEIEGGIDPAFGGTIVFLGDYIDYGPEPKKVLDFLMGLQDTDNIKHIFLKGNHEDFMTTCRREMDYHIFDLWYFNGGQPTVDDFDVGFLDLCNGALDDYVDWLDDLPVIEHDRDYVFVHAGINTNVTLDNQDRQLMMWNFYRNTTEYAQYNKIVVHGHIMRKGGPIIDLPNNRIWMDNGMNLFHKPATVALPEFDDGTNTYPKIIWAP